MFESLPKNSLDSFSSYGTDSLNQSKVSIESKDEFNNLSISSNDQDNSELLKRKTSQTLYPFLQVAFVLLFFILVLQANNNSITKVKRNQMKPNVVFILADDLGWNSLGYATNDEIMESLTPNLMKISSNGIRLTNHYSQEMCTPARASLLTGRYPISVGMHYKNLISVLPWGLNLDETLISEVMQDNGYSTYALGKWHLGFFTSDYLPTARGFDSFLGYLNGESYYWSKTSADYDDIKDFLIGSGDCYGAYSGDDSDIYSTTLYTNKAIEIINSHKDSDDPFFLYLSYQAVHNPYNDVNGDVKTGIPSSYLPSKILSSIESSTDSTLRREYLKVLYLLDENVGNVYDTLLANGQMDNTYVIFASDNGGCILSGGYNGPLRGSKGSLWEGGVKTDAFIVSPLLGNTDGQEYDGLFHISDWFPTLISLTGVSYNPSSSKPLDGIDHSSAWLQGSSSPRTKLLYNLYYNVEGFGFEPFVNGSVAVRNEKYKLIFQASNQTCGEYGFIYPMFGGSYFDDDAITSFGHCKPEGVTGDTELMLFDLINDPYETTNLYDSTNEEIISTKEELLAYIEELKQVTTLLPITDIDTTAESYWTDNSLMVPWYDSVKENAPSYCEDMTPSVI